MFRPSPLGESDLDKDLLARGVGDLEKDLLGGGGDLDMDLPRGEGDLEMGVPRTGGDPENDLPRGGDLDTDIFSRAAMDFPILGDCETERALLGDGDLE